MFCICSLFRGVEINVLLCQKNSYVEVFFSCCGTSKTISAILKVQYKQLQLSIIFSEIMY